MTKKWTRSGDWCLTSGQWRIAKAIVGGTPRYTLTRDNKTHNWCGVVTARIIGIYDTAAQAMEAAA